MKNKLMGMFGGNKPIKTTQITRLDKGVVWDLMPQEEKYTEQNLSDMRATLSGTMLGGQDTGDDGSGLEDVKWSEPQVTVESTGKTEKIAGHTCSQSLVKMVVEGERAETGEKMTVTIDLDMMMAKDVAGFDDYRTFHQKYAETIGIEGFSNTMFGGGMVQALDRYGVGYDELAMEAQKLEGVPLRTVMKMSGEGGQFAQMGAGMSDEDRHKMEEAQAEARKALGKFGGLFGGGRKDNNEDEKEAEEMAATSDGGSFMTVTTEVTEISTSSIKASTFEIPAKYKRISRNN